MLEENNQELTIAFGGIRGTLFCGRVRCIIFFILHFLMCVKTKEISS